MEGLKNIEALKKGEVYRIQKSHLREPYRLSVDRKAIVKWQSTVIGFKPVRHWLITERDDYSYTVKAINDAGE